MKKVKPCMELIGIISLAVVIGFTMSACDDGGSGSGGTTGGRGTLIIENSPGSGYVFILDHSDPPPLSQLSIGTIALGLAVDRSTYDLSVPPYGSVSFSRTGSYLVVFLYSGNYYVMGNVSFRNGSATVNFNNMTLIPPM